MENEIYAACWFDGDKAVMMAGTRNSEGQVTPLAVERRTGLSAGSVANGVIALNEENRTMVSSLVQLMANRLTTAFNETYSIRGLYLGVMPRSMRGIHTSGEKVQDTRRYVRDEDIDEVRRKANAEASTFGEVLALYNNGFELDGAATRHAKDEVAKKVKINTLAVVVNKNFATDYKALMPTKDPSVALYGVMPAGVAVASVVTRPEERLDGVLSVHFCGSTTLFTAYRDDQVIATCVVPFGEEDVIHDMCCDFNIKMNGWRTMYDNWDFVSGASNIKIKDNTGMHHLDSKTIEQMNFAAESRISEIYNIAIAWIRTQMQDFDSLINHIVFTGSIADKKGFIDYVKESLLPDTKYVLRLGDIMDSMTDSQYAGDADYLPLVGMIKMASENCVERKTTQNVEELVGGQEVKKPGRDEDTYNPKQPSLFSRLVNSLKEDNSL